MYLHIAHHHSKISWFLCVFLFLEACTPFIHYDFTSHKEVLKSGELRLELGSAMRLKPKRDQKPSKFYGFDFIFDTPREDIRAFKIHINYLKNASGQIILTHHDLPEKPLRYTKRPKYGAYSIKNRVGQYGAYIELDGLELKFEDHQAEFKISIYGKQNIVEEKTLKFDFETNYYESIIEYIVQ